MTELERCYVAALRILSHRFNSEMELRRKLRGKKFDGESIESAVARLRAERWLDDERFAGAFVRTRLQKRIGPQRILRELHAAGIEESLASRAVEEHLQEGIERQSLEELCQRRSRLLARRHGESYLGSDEARNKLALYLLKQGYESSLVWEVVKESLGR